MSLEPLGIGMIGYGTVGSGVAALLRDQAELYAARVGRPIELRRVLVRNPAKAAAAGADAALVTNDPDAFFATDMDILVEVAGGKGVIGDYVRRALRDGVHMVTANKSLLAADGPELFALAREHRAAIAFEASCAGGIPCLTALQFGLMANRVQGLYGILNGTCNYILTEMTRSGKTYADALCEAQHKGYAEADPTLDVSGADAAQKLAILASLAFGVKLDEADVPTVGIDTLELEDARFGAELGYDIKLLAIAERTPGSDRVSANVQPCFIHRDQLLAQVTGPMNALSVYGHAVGHTLYYGAGAGRLPTASAVVSDVLNLAAGWYPAAFGAMALTPDRQPDARLVAPADLRSRFYLRLNALDAAGTVAQVTRVLGDRDISISAVLQHEVDANRFVPLVVTTHAAPHGAVEDATARIEALDCVEQKVRLVRIVDMP